MIITVNKQKAQEPPQEEEKAEAANQQQAAALGTPAMHITHVTGEGSDPRVRPPAKTIKEPMVSQASKAIKKASLPT